MSPVEGPSIPDVWAKEMLESLESPSFFRDHFEIIERHYVSPKLTLRRRWRRWRWGRWYDVRRALALWIFPEARGWDEER